MDTFQPSSFGALLFSVVLLVSALWAQRQAKARAPRNVVADPKLDTVQDWPPQVVRILSLPERQAYNLLRKAVPGHLVLAQVPLSRFISVPTRNAYSQWLHRVGRLTVDLVVCDFSSRAIAVIEVRSPGETERSRRRHERVAEVLRTAGLKVHVWNETALPSVTEARALFLDKGTEEELQVDASGRRMLPVAEIQELLAAGDDADYHAQEPVPSTFFDDLDALPPTPAPSRRAAAA